MQARRTILVVEDEADLRDIIVEVLRDQGHQVIEASDGREGAIALAQQAVHLVVSDIRMPNMSGLEFFQSAKRSHSEVPFVFLTAFGDTENIMNALRLGAFDFIKKPFEIGEMGAVIDRALEVGYRRAAILEEIAKWQPAQQEAIQRHTKMANLLQIQNNKKRA